MSTSRYCYVIDCPNGDRKLQQWQQMPCEVHDDVPHISCGCPEPFDLFNFPSHKMDSEGRQRWLKSFERADEKRPYLLKEPSPCHRVCSRHFRHGKPTVEFPDPDQNLGHFKRKRDLNTERAKRYRKRLFVSPSTDDEPCGQPRDVKPQERKPRTVSSMSILARFIIFVLISLLRKEKGKNANLLEENRRLRRENLKLRTEIVRSKNKVQKVSHGNTLRCDKDVLFYTGLESRKLFDALYNVTGKYVQRRWRGKKSEFRKVRKFHTSPRKFGPQRKLHGKDEFLLTLMRLRLGLIRDHLAGLFGISGTACSYIFSSWLTAMDKVFRKSLLFWPSKEQVHLTKPARYRAIPGLRAIIDCTEIFLETPKDLALQACTWSNYKHHHTGKILIAVAPNSMITFVSVVYGGRASDKAIVIHSNFLDNLEAHDVLQADKGFNIFDECAARLITFHVPPGKRGVSQMSSAAVNKTKRVANLRILVEQAIRRLKTYRILKYEVPISQIHNLDKIVRVCSAMCNLKQPIYKN